MDNWQSELSPFESEDGFEGDYSGYLENPEANPGPYDPSKPLWRNPADNHRNPRSKIRASTAAPPQGSTTQTPMDYDIYDYQNVQKSRSKLMQDLNSSPTEILKQTYFKNLERQLRKSRFQQRDIESEADKVKENEQIQAAIEEKKKELANTSESLWDLETEKEEEDRKNGYWRGKREVNTNSSAAVYGIPRVTSTGRHTILIFELVFGRHTAHIRKPAKASNLPPLFFNRRSNTIYKFNKRHHRHYTRNVLVDAEIERKNTVGGGHRMHYRKVKQHEKYWGYVQNVRIKKNTIIVRGIFRPYGRNLHERMSRSERNIQHERCNLQEKRSFRKPPAAFRLQPGTDDSLQVAAGMRMSRGNK